MNHGEAVNTDYLPTTSALLCSTADRLGHGQAPVCAPGTGDPYSTKHAPQEVPTCCVYTGCWLWALTHLRNITWILVGELFYTGLNPLSCAPHHKIMTQPSASGKPRTELELPRPLLTRPSSLNQGQGKIGPLGDRRGGY